MDDVHGYRNFQSSEKNETFLERSTDYNNYVTITHL